MIEELRLAVDAAYRFHSHVATAENISMTTYEAAVTLVEIAEQNLARAVILARLNHAMQS